VLLDIENHPRKPLESRGGRLWSEAVEITAAWHCNISCQSCSHGSPSMPHRVADPGDVERDLRHLAERLRVEHVRVLGGEPLVHPDVTEVLRAVRRSGITDTLRVLTNGLRLADQPATFWSEVDEVHVSVYPNTRKYLGTRREAIIATAAASGTRLTFKTFDHFRLSFRAEDHDDHLTEAVYRTCQIANRWRCLTVESGRIYRCPQSALLGSQHPPYVAADSLEIEQIESTEVLRRWIERDEPLDSCTRCAGSVGFRHPHRMSGGRTAEEASGPEVVDYSYLERLAADPDADNGCVAVEQNPT
jgi:organic radical activating enzyme